MYIIASVTVLPLENLSGCIFLRKVSLHRKYGVCVVVCVWPVVYVRSCKKAFSAAVTARSLFGTSVLVCVGVWVGGCVYWVCVCVCVRACACVELSACVNLILSVVTAGWKKCVRGGGIGLTLATAYVLFTSKDRIRSLLDKWLILPLWFHHHHHRHLWSLADKLFIIKTYTVCLLLLIIKASTVCLLTRPILTTMRLRVSSVLKTRFSLNYLLWIYSWRVLTWWQWRWKWNYLQLPWHKFSIK